MNAFILPLANVLGATVDQIKALLCLLIAYPLAHLFTYIPVSRPGQRHLFSIAVTFFFFVVVLEMYSAFFQFLGSSLATYYIAKSDHSRKMPWLVFAIVMAHLVYNHVRRTLSEVAADAFEITAPQMVLTMKLTTFAWNVWDGRRKFEDLDKWQASKRITKFPSLLEFLGYSFYFPGVLVGPYLDFTEYTGLVNGNTFSKDPESKHDSPRGRKRAAYSKMATGFAFLGAFVLFHGTMNYNTALTQDFARKNFVSRLVLFQVFAFFERSRFYALWTLTEGATIVSGFGFTGFSSSGTPLWDGAANTNLLEVEIPTNLKRLLDFWNMKTNVWLRECVYKRVTPNGKKPGFRSSMIAFFTSALWHGVAPGYYLCFIYGGFIVTAGRLARSSFRPLLLPRPGEKPSFIKRVYDILGTILTLMVANYGAAPFFVSTIPRTMQIYKVMLWHGYIIIFGGLLFFYLGGTRLCANLQKRKGVLLAQNGNGQPTPVAEKNFLVPPTVGITVDPLSRVQIERTSQ